MGFYMGWRGGGSVPQTSLDSRMHENYAFMCVSVEFSVCLSVCLSI